MIILFGGQNDIYEWRGVKYFDSEIIQAYLSLIIEEQSVTKK